MALVVTIAGVDRTSIINEDLIRITQLADTFTFTAELEVFDENSDISITAGSRLVADEITIVDGATTYFGGYVTNQDVTTFLTGPRKLSLQCQGYGILLAETLVEYEGYFPEADDFIINDLFDTYLPAIDSVTDVAQLDASMDIEFSEMSLAEIMDALCERTGGRWYIDNIKTLHYFADENDDSGFDLSDTPAPPASYTYHDDPEKRVDGTQIVNRVRVIGADEYSVTRNDAGSQATYGIRGTIITDQGLTTTAELEERGDAVLLKYKDPKITYVVRTAHGGAVAGQEVDLKCVVLGLAALTTFTIRELYIYWELGDPVYEMVLGEAEITALQRAGGVSGYLRSVIVNPPLPLSARGWGHDMVFSATDHDTVAWTGGTITTAGGVGSFSIDAGNTGNMAATTYVFLDVNVSSTVLQVGASAANAVGAGRILVAVCENVAAGLNAIFLVYGSATQSTLVDTASIAAGAVTGAKIAALTIAAGNIAAGAVETAKIAALAVEAGNIAGLAITTEKLAALAVTGAKVAALTIEAGNIAAATITGAKIAALTIEAANIAAGTITGAKIAAVTITAANIAALTITAAEIAALTITGAKIAAGTITGVKIAGLTIEAGHLVANTITAGQIAAATITGNEINANAIAAGHIQANAITTAKINDLAVSGSKLSIGDSGIFSAADGKLLLGPGCERTGTAWKSLRGQVATITGAPHTVAGAFDPEKRALVVEGAAINRIDNPSFEVNITDGWAVHGANTGTNSRSTDQAFKGTASLKQVGAASWPIMTYNISGDLALDTHFTVSAWYYCASDLDRVPRMNVVYDGANHYTDGDLTQRNRWRRLTYTFYPSVDISAAEVILHFSAAGTGTLYWDGVQLEVGPFVTSYADGSLGLGYTWSGTVHNSRSTRAATAVNLNDHVKLISENDTLSFRIVAQMPYDADGSWPTGYLMDAIGAGGVNRIYVKYDMADDKFKAYLRDGGGDTTTLESAVQTWKAGRWIDLVFTCDFNAAGAGDYRLSIDGVQVATSTAANIVAPTLTAWRLGTQWDNTGGANAAIAEYAVFDDLLSAAEVAALWNLRRAMVDYGAVDSPGIYIYDGKFSVASAYTGTRIEITGSEIAGYLVATKQFWLQATDGKAYAGAGAVRLDANGIEVEASTAYVDLRSYKFVNTAGTVISRIVSSYDTTNSVNSAALTVRPIANYESKAYLSALAPAGKLAQAFMETTQQGGTDAYVRCQVSAGNIPTIVNVLDGTVRLEVSGVGVDVAGRLAITDGIVAPDVLAGFACLYVDSADGDLKCRFADGFVATIAADS